MVEMATTPPVENIFESEDIAISHWDIHFYFFQTDVKDVESAQSIQAAFRARFPSIKTFDLVKEPVGQCEKKATVREGQRTQLRG